MAKNDKTKLKKALDSNDSYVKTYVEDQTGGKRMEIELGTNVTVGRLIKTLLKALNLPDDSDYSLIFVSQNAGWKILDNDDLLYEMIKADSSSFLRLVPNLTAG